MKLEEMKILVTGAAQGLGKHYAFRLAEAGAQVVAADIGEAGLEALVQESKGLKGKVFARKLNVANEEEIVSAVDFAKESMGGINGLINNAGILRDGLLVKKDRTTGAIVRLSKADWQAVIDVNLTGPMLLAREVAATMIETSSKGVIVNISSIARHGNRGQSNYSAAKAALAADTKVWTLELASFGIRVGAVAPIECEYFTGRTVDVDSGLTV